ncbi:MAG: DUF6152 family protein [Caulobacteraceae bacterium]
MTPYQFGRFSLGAAFAIGLLSPPSGALAHHSFAVFFSSDKELVSLKGTVKEYHFTNPHGIIEIIVTTPSGAQEDWKIETNSPSILSRRGWSKTSIASGEVVTVQGWPARDGSKYMRLRAAFRADGAPIGMPPDGNPSRP